MDANPMSNYISVHNRLNAARRNAIGDGVPVRRKDSTLYRLLAECLAICELVELNKWHNELRNSFKVSVDIRGAPSRQESNNGRGRRFAYPDSDTYILVARFVLEGVDNRNSVYRYAGVLREAAKRQISSTVFQQWLHENGGAKSLYAPTN